MIAIKIAILPELDGFLILVVQSLDAYKYVSENTYTFIFMYS